MEMQRRLAISLLLLRLGVFIVMVMWTLDKFVNPGHAAAVAENFYKMGGLGSAALYLIGAVQLVVVLAFVAGFFKRISYGLVLLMHAVSTFSSYQQYIDAWNNLLFFAAWPMLAACIALYLLRDTDTLLSLDAMRHRKLGSRGTISKATA
ncbi:MAG: DoxX family membrane protein [Phycisphaeraceae bacterium]